MDAYIYLWSLRPQDGVAIELRVTAPSAVVARRQVLRFLEDHEGATWAVERVSRESSHVPFSPLHVAPAG